MIFSGSTGSLETKRMASTMAILSDCVFRCNSFSFSVLLGIAVIVVLIVIEPVLSYYRYHLFSIRKWYQTLAFAPR